ncbi:protein VraC [Staphylococcus argenteus]|uniref:protein VraC n=1 Tax=Staphylococcus argenteus TaxID=985002 RepID=UPI00178CE841|nr:protein VraC [Staphylococcus argenteus]MBE2152657.1 protein VraC [Staphylococcus argenteus]
MQHYLADSNQRLNVIFSKDSVAAYYQCFNKTFIKEVPPLMCASLWPKFEIFKQYSESELILTKTAIDQSEKIETDMTYVACLEEVKRQQIRHITRYTMTLTLFKNNQHVITITQTFIKVMNQSEI